MLYLDFLGFSFGFGLCCLKIIMSRCSVFCLFVLIFILFCVLWGSKIWSFFISLNFEIFCFSLLNISAVSFSSGYSNYPYITPFEIATVLWCSVVFVFFFGPSLFCCYYYYFCISFWEVSADLASNSLTFSECWVYWWAHQRHSSFLFACFWFLNFLLILSKSIIFCVLACGIFSPLEPWSIKWLQISL